MAASVRLAGEYDAFLLDLDGVVYRGDLPIPGAAEAVAALRQEAGRVVFLTNNSARTPEQVADKLAALGVPASAEEVVTSAQATASLLARDGGGSAFVIGEDGVRTALAEAGIEVVDGDADRATFVVVGWDRALDYDKLRTASVLVGRGSRLVATNADASYPAPDGDLWPGAGALLAAVETATGSRATVVGKPHLPLFEEALERAGTRAALVVGDRIETDVAGAGAAGLDAVLVLSGAASPADLLDHDALPLAVLDDMGGLVVERPDAPLRPAGPGHMESVRALTEAPDEAPPWGPEGVVVAGREEVVATATAEVRDDDAYLRAVATRQESRGQHLGDLVVAFAVGQARRRGATWCYLLTEAAEGFFARLGFERVDRTRIPSWIEGVGAPGRQCSESAVAMARPIAQKSRPRTYAGRPRVR